MPADPRLTAAGPTPPAMLELELELVVVDELFAEDCDVVELEVDELLEVDCDSELEAEDVVDVDKELADVVEVVVIEDVLEPD